MRHYQLAALPQAPNSLNETRHVGCLVRSEG